MLYFISHVSNICPLKCSKYEFSWQRNMCCTPPLNEIYTTTSHITTNVTKYYTFSQPLIGLLLDILSATVTKCFLIQIISLYTFGKNVVTIRCLTGYAISVWYDGKLPFQNTTDFLTHIVLLNKDKRKDYKTNAISNGIYSTLCIFGYDKTATLCTYIHHYTFSRKTI